MFTIGQIVAIDSIEGTVLGRIVTLFSSIDRREILIVQTPSFHELPVYTNEAREATLDERSQWWDSMMGDISLDKMIDPRTSEYEDDDDDLVLVLTDEDFEITIDDDSDLGISLPASERGYITLDGKWHPAN